MLSAFSRARVGGRHQVAAGSWPGAGAATGMLLIDSAIARTKQTNKRRLPPIALAKVLQEKSYSKERSTRQQLDYARTL